MELPDFFTNGAFENFYYLLTNSIYILLPISIFLLLLPKISSKVTIFLLGMYISYSIFIPYLLKLPFFANFINSVGDYNFIVFLILSIILAFVFYYLVKVAIALGGFLLGGLIGYFIGSLIISSQAEWINNLPFPATYIPWIIFAVIGIIIAVVFAKNYSFIISSLSVIFGAFILSFYTIYLLEKYTSVVIGDNSLLEGWSFLSQPEFLSIFIVLIIYITIGFYLVFRTNKKTQKY